MPTKYTSPKSQRKFATIWGELEYVCRKIHCWLYEKHDKAAAKRYQNRLKRILENLPKNNLAILRAEGLALMHELNAQNSSAIKYRQREIKLIERAHDSVHESVKAGNYDA